MIHFIFEDNEQTPTSQALSKSYMGDYIHFAGCNDNVGKCVRVLTKKYPDDDFIIYFDVSPNNSITVNKFQKVCNYVRKFNGRVKVIPFPCIEYVVLSMLEKNNLLRYKDSTYQDILDNLNEFTDWLKVKSIVNQMGRSKISIENIFKLLLSNHAETCFHNRASLGTFYTSDCSCSSDCNNLSSLSLKTKAELIYTSLPLFYVMKDGKHEAFLDAIGVRREDSGIKAVLDKMKSYYDSLSEYLGTDAEEFSFELCSSLLV